MPKPSSDREGACPTDQRGDEGLPELVGQLGEHVVQLVDSKLGLLKIELDEAARAYATGAIELAIAAIVALVGFALSATSIAFALVYLLPESWLDPSLNRALAFGLVGGVALIVGLVFTARGRARFESSEQHTALASRARRQTPRARSDATQGARRQ